MKRIKTPKEIRAELRLEILYAVTAAVVAISLLLTVHLKPKFIGPDGTKLCDPIICVA